MDEMRYITPLFAECVRWTVYAEKLAGPLQEARNALAVDIPNDLPPTVRTKMNAIRRELRRQAHQIEFELSLRDDPYVETPGIMPVAVPESAA